MSIYNQLEILRSTKIALNNSIESLGEDLNNKIFGQYSDAVANVLAFLQQLDSALDDLIDGLTESKNNLAALDLFLQNGDALLQKILDPVEE